MRITSYIDVIKPNNTNNRIENEKQSIDSNLDVKTHISPIKVHCEVRNSPNK